MHVNDLLRLNGPAFVEAAYFAILKRQVDPSGLEHFMDRLALGHGKEAILVALASSDEAKGSRIDLAGLKGLIRRRKRSPFRLFLRFFADLKATQRQVARIEHLLAEQRRLSPSVATLSGTMTGRVARPERSPDTGAPLEDVTNGDACSDTLQRTLLSIRARLANKSHDHGVFVDDLRNTIRSSALFFVMGR